MVSVSILLNIGNALLLVVAVAISALVLDWPLRYWQGSKVELVRVSTTGTSAKQEHRLIVYLAGIMAQSQDSSQDVSPLWLKHGNVLFVEYQGKRFRASEVVDKVVAFISDHDEHDEIVVIGSSMGGLLGYDVIRRLDAATQSKVVFLAIDAPTSARDFYLPSNVFAQFMRLPFGPIWNLLSGDLNVAHTADDLANPKANEKKHGFTVEERGGFDAFVKAGFIDTFRLFTQGNGHYTWWTHWANARARNVGWRIDYWLASSSLKDKIKSAKIHPNVMGSDHCPVSIELSL